MDLAVIPECFVDTNLIETLVPPIGKGYNHQKGCGTVTKVMKAKFANSFAVGIIDKDKRQVDYLNEFDEVVNAGTLLLHKHKTKPHYIIQISPAIESFIMQSANSVGVSVTDFSLSADKDLFQKKNQNKNKVKKTLVSEIYLKLQKKLVLLIF